MSRVGSWLAQDVTGEELGEKENEERDGSSLCSPLSFPIPIIPKDRSHFLTLFIRGSLQLIS